VCIGASGAEARVLGLMVLARLKPRPFDFCWCDALW